MAELKKGHIFAIQGPTEKKIRVRLYFVLMLLMLHCFFGDCRCGPLLFMVILVIYKYKKR